MWIQTQKGSKQNVKILIVSEGHIKKYTPEVNSEYWREIVEDMDNVLLNGTRLMACVYYQVTERRFDKDFCLDFIPYYDEAYQCLFWHVDLPIVGIGVETNYPPIHIPQQLFPTDTVTITRVICYNKCLPICFVEARQS